MAATISASGGLYRSSMTNMSSPELGPSRGQLLALPLRDARILQLEGVERVDGRGRDDQPGEPFVVGRDHIPWRVGRRGGANRVLVRGHVLAPVPPFQRVGRREFPVLRGVVDALQKATALFAARYVEEKLADRDAVAGQV